MAYELLGHIYVYIYKIIYKRGLFAELVRGAAI